MFDNTLILCSFNPMQPLFLKAIKVVWKMILGVLVFVALYVTFVFVVPKIPVNRTHLESDSEMVDVYILTNGVHTDIVMPINSRFYDWRPFIDPSDTKSQDPDVRYAAFGWGDKGFYLDTPTWADLKFSTAFKAAFWLGSSAMHVTYHKELKEGDRCRRMQVSKQDFLKMIEYVKSSFRMAETNGPILIDGASYEQYDAFYEGIGTYNLFFTCNTWANDALKSGNQRACLWAARQEDIFSKYE